MLSDSVRVLTMFDIPSEIRLQTFWNQQLHSIDPTVEAGS
jgi:hypothetical protein